MLKNVNLLTKILAGFGLAILFFIFIGFIGLNSVSNISDSAMELQYMDEIKINLLEREIDHLNFVNKVSEGLRDVDIKVLQVKKDDHACNLGKFLYGDERRKAESIIPDLIPVFKALESPHHDLHRSVIEMDDMLSDPEINRQDIWDYYNAVTIPALLEVRRKINIANTIISHDSEITLEGFQATKRAMRTTVIITLLVGLAFALFIGIVIRRSIKKPIEQLLSQIQKLADGDLSNRVEDYSEDELGTVTQALNEMAGHLDESILTVAENARRLKKSAEELNSVSQTLSENARDMNEKATNVASASEEMSVTMDTVSDTSGQATGNIGTVAQNTEEMTSTVNEIAQNSEKAHQITQQAVENVQGAAEKVNELGAAASDISKVIDVILDIAEQTKLLALNATIEAARAGEAGKGFAVVASEVKELAGQTNNATEEIRKRVNAIQNSTDATVAEIDSINSVIGQVDEIVSTIATAVEEQNVTTRDISANINQAAQGIQEMAENVNQTAEVAKSVASDVASVSASSENVYSESALVDAHTNDLMAINTALNDVVNQFKLSKEVSLSSGQDILIVWGPKIKIGIDVIDRQHKRLVDLINELHRAMKQRKGAEVLSRIMNGLVDYTKEHFDYEEGLQAKAGYPDLDTHKEVHRNLVKKVEAYQAKIKDGEKLVTKDLSAFLKDWLVNHILGTDTKYVPYFKKAGIN